MRLPVITQRPALGVFGKGAPGSVALNFGPSGGANCPNECPYHPESTNPSRGAVRCYAAKAEARPDRQTLAAKLQRHEERGAASVIRQAIAELEANAAAGYVPIWLRVSAFGSVPQYPRGDVAKAFRELFATVTRLGIPLHFPVYGTEIARRYRRLAKGYTYQTGKLAGLPVTIRQSIDPENIGRARGATATTAGTMDQRPAERLTTATAEARKKRGAAVCPAIASATTHGRGKGSPKAKCGRCTLCAEPGRVIVYPAHA
jgi:hypothetical protein